MRALLWLLLLLHPSACESRGPPIETHSKLEAHAQQLEAELPKKSQNVQADPDEPQKPRALRHAKAESIEEHGDTSKTKSHRGGAAPSRIAHDKMQGIGQAVGDMMASTGSEPQAVKEVMQALSNAKKSVSSAAHKDGSAPPAPGAAPDSNTSLSFEPPTGNASAVLAKEIPNPYRVTGKHAKRAEKFKDKMRSHVDEMHDALHEHTRDLQQQAWLDNQRKLNAEKEMERATQEREKARRKAHENKLRMATEEAMREQRAKALEASIQNRTVAEASYRSEPEPAPRDILVPRRSQRSGSSTWGLAAPLAMLAASVFA